jgi:hypothetical protein
MPISATAADYPARAPLIGALERTPPSRRTRRLPASEPKKAFATRRTRTNDGAHSTAAPHGVVGRLDLVGTVWPTLAAAGLAASAHISVPESQHDLRRTRERTGPSHCTAGSSAWSHRRRDRSTEHAGRCAQARQPGRPRRRRPRTAHAPPFGDTAPLTARPARVRAREHPGPISGPYRSSRLRARRSRRFQYSWCGAAIA